MNSVFKRSLKYLVIIVINALLLTVLLHCWADRLFGLLNPGYIKFEMIKIIGLSIGLLFLIAIVITVAKDYGLQKTKSKIILCGLLTVLASLLLYIDYVPKISFDSQQNQLRNQIAQKQKRLHNISNSYSWSNLDYNEYTQITNSKWFPKIQNEASNITINYLYDGFLPDYSFFLEYSLPLRVALDSTNLNYGTIHIDTIGQLQQIEYNEYVD